MATNDHMLSEYLRKHKPNKQEEQEEEPSQKDRPPPGKYHRQIEEQADIDKSYQWLDKELD